MAHFKSLFLRRTRRYPNTNAAPRRSGAALYRLQELPTRKAHIVEILLLGAVITLLLSRRLLRAVQERLRHTSYKMPEQRWAAIFAAAAPTILDIVVLPPRVSNVIARRLESMLLNEAPDPNRSRQLLLENVESSTVWA